MARGNFWQGTGQSDASTCRAPLCGNPKHPLARPAARLCLYVRPIAQIRAMQGSNSSQAEEYIMCKLMFGAGRSTHLGKVGCVGSNLVRDDTRLDVIPVGQAQVLLGGDIAQKSGACRVRQAHGAGCYAGQQHAPADCALGAGAGRLPEGKALFQRNILKGTHCLHQASHSPTGDSTRQHQRCSKVTSWVATAACSGHRPHHAANFSQSTLCTCCHCAEAECQSTAYSSAACCRQACPCPALVEL